MMRANRRDGFTLIEMIVSVAVLAVITVYMTGLLVQQSRGYEVVDDVAEAQQTERAIGDLLERDVLATGMLIRGPGIVSGRDNVGPAGALTDVLCVTDSDAIGDPTSLGEGLLGTRVTFGYTGSGVDNLVLAAPSLEQRNNPFEPAQNAYDNSNPQDGVADSDFFFDPTTGQAGGVIVIDANNPASGSRCGLIVNITGAAPVVRVDWGLTVDGAALDAIAAVAAVGVPSWVAIPAHIYYVRPARVVGGVTQAPQLMRDGMLLADDVEDLQVAYFHDLDRDGNCDANEWTGGDCPLPGAQAAPIPAYNPDASNNCFLRAVRFNFVVRTANQDSQAQQNANLASGTFIQLENAPARPAILDGFRRRAFSRTVLPRNAPIRSGDSPRGCTT